MRLFLLLITSLLLSNCSSTDIKIAKDCFTHRSEKNSSDQSQLIFDKIKMFPNRTELSLAIKNDNHITFFGVKRLNDTLVETSNCNKLFEISSISKVFTSTNLVNIVLQNHVKLSTCIQAVVDYDIPLKKEISLIELANHTSDLPKQPKI